MLTIGLNADPTEMDAIVMRIMQHRTDKVRQPAS